MWSSSVFRRSSILAFVFTVLVAPHNARAAQPASLAVDAAWEPWLGCWELVDDRGRAASARDASGTGDGLRPRICVVPDGSAAVSVLTYVGEKRVLAQQIVTDGQPHPLDDRDCRGEQRAEWSRDSARVFTRAKVSCGSEAPRSVSSLTLMATGPTWIDIQHVETGGRGHLRVRRYSRGRDQRIPGAPPNPDATDAMSNRARTALPIAQLSVAAVAEAARLMPSEVVEAALVETGLGFVVNARSLVALDDSGVPDRVIDLAVALAYPSKFNVDRPDPDQFGPLMSGLGVPLGGNALGIDPWGLASSDPYFWPYYASPIGYGYWGSINPLFFPTAGYVAIGDGGTTDVQRSGSGRVVNGLGYTQVRERTAAEVAGDAAPAGATGGQTSSGGRVSTQGYSGGGDVGVSSGGSSGGSGGGGDSGRTAQPR